MKRNRNLFCLLSLIALLCGSYTAYGQTVLTIDGGQLVHSGRSTINLNNTQFINNGTYQGGEDAKVYITGDGTDEQSAIGGDSVTTFFQLEIFKSSNGVQLQQNIMVDRELILEEGNLDLHGDTITFGPDGFIENESEDGRVVGPNGGVVQIMVDLNAPRNRAPGNMGLSISSDQNLGATLVQREHMPVSLNDTVGIARTYKIFPTNNSNLGATVKLDYFEGELNGHSESELGIWRRDSSFWYNPSSTLEANLDRLVVENVDFLAEEWTIASTAPKIQLKAFLQGAYSNSTQQMEDALRSLDLLPRAEPYADLGFVHVASGGGESIDPPILTATSDSAIVDWVFVELRDATDSTNVIAARSGLITKSGNIIDLDGKSPLSFPGLPTGNNYYIALRHRNHLGVMTASPIAVTRDGSSSYDFTDRNLTAYTDPTRPQAAQYDNGTHCMLWAGDANGDNQIVYVGNTDITPISAAVFLNPLNPTFDPTVAVSNTYDRADTNMDGDIIYVGDTDITPISASVFLHPLNLGIFDPLFIIYQQLPE
ncbi:MAG: hypothetical protein AAFV95_01965 [Bacteroidota bacterium]